jgi:RNA recognition motif. (a.k.a. RRM, RBD, or RNP domain)
MNLDVPLDDLVRDARDARDARDVRASSSDRGGVRVGGGGGGGGRRPIVVRDPATGETRLVGGGAASRPGPRVLQRLPARRPIVVRDPATGSTRLVGGDGGSGGSGGPKGSDWDRDYDRGYDRGYSGGAAGFNAGGGSGFDGGRYGSSGFDGGRYGGGGGGIDHGHHRRGSISKRIGERGVGATASAVPEPKLLVGNLHPQVTTDDLRELFENVGPLTSVVLYDRAGNQLEFAEVTFVELVDACYALEKYNGVPLDDRPLRISLSQNSTPALQHHRDYRDRSNYYYGSNNNNGGGYGYGSNNGYM